MMRPIAIALFVILAAQPAVADKKGAAAGAIAIEQAKTHFKAGEAAFAAGQYDQAIAEYQAAYDLVPRAAFIFNIGSAYRRKAEVTHDLADKKAAVDFYQRYLASEPSGKAVTDANAYIQALSREIDESAPRTTEPIAAPPPPEPEITSPEAILAPPPVEPPAGDRGKTLRITGLIAGGVGVALVATGVYFGLKASSTASDVDALKDHWDQSLYESGQSANRNMVICFGAGAAAIAGGTVLYLLGRSQGNAESTQVGFTGTGVVVSGSFR